MNHSLSKEKVCVVVPTYNRKVLLQECLSAIKNQTRLPDRILVINNASTDGTEKMLREKYPDLEVIHETTNSGSAGGFSIGMKWAFEQGYEWIWVVDNDAIPEPQALDELLKAGRGTYVGRQPWMLLSRILWIDRDDHPMNAPRIENSNRTLMYETALHGYLPIRAADFGSLLIRATSVEKYGYPVWDYFTWSDDLEYSARVLRWELGLIVPQSIVVHKTERKAAPIQDTGPRYYFDVRNRLWMILYSEAWSRTEKIRLIAVYISNIFKFLIQVPDRKAGLKSVVFGILHALSRKPEPKRF